MRIRNFLLRFRGKKKQFDYVDFAPWVTNLIKEFEKFPNIELHIISPFTGLTRYLFEFEMNSIFYHFYQPDIPIIHFRFPKLYSFDFIPKYPLSRLIVKKLINGIKPDIVNLLGAENPYYSIHALDIKNIPIYLSVQTIYSNPDRKKFSDKCLKLNWDIELKLHGHIKYFGCSGRIHRDLVLKNNPESIIFKMFFPLEKPIMVNPLPKIFDFVFFAGLSKKKGVEDLIEALALVKKEKNDVSLDIVGQCSDTYRQFLSDRINFLGLTENITFHNYFKEHTDMHQHIVQAQFAVLPVKLDIIPQSVMEAILLGLPVITYKTSGMPYLNKDGESVLISEIGDITLLANNMIKLLNSPALADKLKIQAKLFVEKEFDNTTSVIRLVNNYHAVIDHFYKSIPIPEDQVFNLAEFPIYN